MVVNNMIARQVDKLLVASLCCMIMDYQNFSEQLPVVLFVAAERQHFYCHWSLLTLFSPPPLCVRDIDCRSPDESIFWGTTRLSPTRVIERKDLHKACRSRVTLPNLGNGLFSAGGIIRAQAMNVCRAVPV